MIGAVVLFNYKGEILTYQIYRDDINRSHAEIFRANAIHSRHQLKSPVITISGISYMYIRKASHWLVAISRENCNAASAFQLLHSIFTILQQCLHPLTPEKIAAKVPVISNILSEVGDNGVPQMTDSLALMSLLNYTSLKVSSKTTQSQLTVQVTGQIGWRNSNIVHKRMEVFLDVKEQIHCLMSSNGDVLTSHVLGVVQMKSSLSGMPECSLGVNDKLVAARSTNSMKSRKTVAIDGCTFHQSVRLSQYESDQSITFVPPDGTFELMSYRTTANIEIPFKLSSIVRELEGGRLEITVVLKSMYAEKTSATGILVTVPLPKSTSSVALKTTKGSAKYSRGQTAIQWKIKKMSGMHEVQLVATVLVMGSGTQSKEGNNISIAFKIEQAFSGLRILYLRIVEPKYNYSEIDVAKWIRYITRNGLFEIRTVNIRN